MAFYEVLTVGIVQFTPMTVAQVEAIQNPKNGMVCLVTNDTISQVCLVTYDETNSEWRVDETGATMAD